MYTMIFDKSTDSVRSQLWPVMFIIDFMTFVSRLCGYIVSTFGIIDVTIHVITIVEYSNNKNVL